MGKNAPGALQAYEGYCDDPEDYQEDDDPHGCYDFLLREMKSSLSSGYRSTLFGSTLSHETIKGMIEGGLMLLMSLKKTMIV